LGEKFECSLICNSEFWPEGWWHSNITSSFN
jgi:hypothetical protein